MRFSLPLLACTALAATGAAHAQSINLPEQLRVPAQESVVTRGSLPASWLTAPKWFQVPSENTGGTGSMQQASAAAALTLRNGAVATGLSGYYDYQSNGMSPGYIEVNPTNRQQIHTTMMLAADPAAQSATRRAGYAYSSDGGATWATNKAVGDVRLGFPYLQTTNDGVAFIAAHGDPDADGAINTVLYFNSLTGSTDFSLLATLPNATATGRGPSGVIWPSFELTQAEDAAVVAASYSNPTSEDLAPLQLSRVSFDTPPTWMQHPDSVRTQHTGGRQVVARSAAGKIGVTWYRFADDTNDVVNGGVYFLESTDNGVTWGDVQVVLAGDQIIEDINLNDDPDTLNALSSLDLAYSGETPHIVFTATINSLYRYWSILHWSPATGVDFAAISHQEVGLGAYAMPAAIVQPNMAPMAYPTVSLGSDGQHVLVAFQAIAQTLNETRDTVISTVSPEGFEYYRVWAVGSADGGNTWGTPWIVQDFAGAGTDSASIEYPALDEHSNVAGGSFELNLQFLAKRFPGMYAFTATGATAGPVNEQFQYVQREEIPLSRFLAGGGGVEAETGDAGIAITALFPNPVKNTATLNLSVARNGNGSVEVWSALGERVATLADGEMVAGPHVYSIDAASLPTGRYFVALKLDGRTVTQPFSIVR